MIQEVLAAIRDWANPKFAEIGKSTDPATEPTVHGKLSALSTKCDGIETLLDARLGKLKVVSAASSMAIDATTFQTSSIVLCHEAVTISSVANLTYEVVFVVDAGVDFSVPAGIPTMGEADSTKRREFSFLEGALVVGNFE